MLPGVLGQAGEGRIFRNPHGGFLGCSGLAFENHPRTVVQLLAFYQLESLATHVVCALPSRLQHTGSFEKVSLDGRGSLTCMFLLLLVMHAPE